MRSRRRPGILLESYGQVYQYLRDADWRVGLFWTGIDCLGNGGIKGIERRTAREEVKGAAYFGLSKFGLVIGLLSFQRKFHNLFVTRGAVNGCK